MTDEQEAVHHACLAGWDALKAEALNVPHVGSSVTAIYSRARERYCARVERGEDPGATWHSEKERVIREMAPFARLLARQQTANSRAGRRAAGTKRRR